MAIQSLLLLFALHGLAQPVPDTGQFECYDDSGEIPCPQPGEAFYGQDANYTINPPSYTKLDAQGNDLPDTAAEWVMVRDDVTGLIWEVKTDDGSVHNRDNTYDWTGTEGFIDALNAESCGGFSDWRLPTAEELRSIVNYGRSNPAIDTIVFPRTVPGYYYSSTRYSGPLPRQLIVGFGYGGVLRSFKYDARYVRAVRGEQSGSFDHLVINGDGTVTDTNTGLMWQQEAPKGMSWQDALSHCENLILGGNDDWRLPNIKELTSLVDQNRYYPTIDTDYFPGMTAPWDSWSSTGTWYVSFDNGLSGTNDKSRVYSVRAVRGGQSVSADNLIISMPAQADRWAIGEKRTIAWEPAGIEGNVKISLSRRGGKPGTFTETIADNTLNSGTYSWTATGPVSFNCALRVEPHDYPEKGATQGLFSISIMENMYVEAEKLHGVGKHRLTLFAIFPDNVIPLSTVWSSSDPSIAVVENNTLSAQRNGWVEVSATYIDKVYKKGLFVYTTIDEMEMESNNTQETANTMSETTFYKASFYAGDIDYYSFTLDSDSVVDIGYLSLSQSSDMSVSIYDAQNTLMASGSSMNGSDVTFPLGLAAGAYYLKVLSSGDVDQENGYVVAYKIVGTLITQGTVPLDLGDTGQDTINHLEDESNFTFTLSERNSIAILFSPSSGSANYHIDLVDGNRNVVDQVECLEQGQVSINAIYPEGGYTVHIIPVDTVDASSPFTIRLSQITDPFEMAINDTYDEASAFNTQQPVTGQLSSNMDIDFYTFQLESPRFLELAFTCPGSDRDFFLTLYKDSDQNPIDGINIQNGQDASLHMGLGIGRYFLRITSDGTTADTVNAYTLTISDSPQTNLEIEANNTLISANAIEKDSEKKGRVFSDADIDYYGFHLADTAVFSVAFDPETATGDYRVSLVDDNDQVFDLRSSVNGKAYTIDSYKTPGDYYIRIESDGDVDPYGQYTLSLTSDAAITGLKQGAGAPDGDVNGNGEVSLADAILGLKVACGLDTLGEYIASGADVNGDNTIGIAEAIYIIQKVSATTTTTTTTPTTTAP